MFIRFRKEKKENAEMQDSFNTDTEETLFSEVKEDSEENEEEANDEL